MFRAHQSRDGLSRDIEQLLYPRKEARGLLHLAVISDRIIRKPSELVPEKDIGDPASLKALCQFLLPEVWLA
nr:hypothetical protein [uncultured Cohaesibacter sp.]